MKKIVKYKIKHCNTCCPHYSHNFEDYENVWCIKLKAKIFDFDISDNIMSDYKERPFPKECPLADAEE